jgi:hypothetical protein
MKRQNDRATTVRQGDRATGGQRGSAAAKGRAPSLKEHYGGETVQIQVPKTWNERQ